MSVKETEIKLSAIKTFFTGNQDNYSAETLAEAIRFVYLNKKLLSIKMTLIIVLIVLVLWNKVDNSNLMSWFVLMLMIRGLSYWQASYFLAQKLSAQETLRWGHYYTFSEFMLGLGYGIAALLFISSDQSIAVQMFILMCIMSLTFGSLSITSHWLASCYALTFPSLGLTTYDLWLQPDSEYKLVAIVPFVTIIMIFSIARIAQQSVLSSIQLRFENIELLQQLKISQKEAEDANIRKTRFLASASHDLRQPVHALELFSATLDDEKITPRGRETLVYMKDCITSLNELLSSLLDISCLDADIVKPTFEHIDVYRLLNRIANNLKGQAENKGIKLKIYGQSAWVNSDSILLENTIRNLLTNAIKYTHQGGVLIACRSIRNKVKIEIWDTGIGIPKSELDNIFEEFYQINNAERDRARGLGLGLSIVMREMGLLGHALSLKSREGKGTVVRITLDRVHPKQASIEQVVLENPRDRLANKKVLIIDDEQSILTATKSLISKWDCVVEIATNCDEASAICKHFTPDVIISDFRLKEHRTGIEVIKQLRLQLHQNIPAILITGDTAPDRLQQAKASELMLLHKPVKPAKLKVAMNMVLSKKIRPSVQSEMVV